MAEVLKVKARDELVRLTERELERKFGDLHAKQQSIAATKFYIREIHNPVAMVIDDDDIDLGVVDGGNDLGCDFIHSDDGRVLIIQSKYRGHGTSEKTEEITRFRNVLKSFRDPKQTSNGRLADAIANIDGKMTNSSWSSSHSVRSTNRPARSPNKRRITQPMCRILKKGAIGSSLMRPTSM